MNVSIIGYLTSRTRRLKRPGVILDFFPLRIGNPLLHYHLLQRCISRLLGFGRSGSVNVLVSRAVFNFSSLVDSPCL